MHKTEYDPELSDVKYAADIRCRLWLSVATLPYNTLQIDRHIWLEGRRGASAPLCHDGWMAAAGGHICMHAHLSLTSNMQKRNICSIYEHTVRFEIWMDTHN
jgi:hypothetical protein